MMNTVNRVTCAVRILAMGFVFILLFQGCASKEKERATAEGEQMTCGVKDGAPVALFNRPAHTNKELFKQVTDDGISAPAGCSPVRASGAAGEAIGWVVLGPNGLPNGDPPAPYNATCSSIYTKCGNPGTSCTKTNGGNGTCKSAIYKGNGIYNPQNPKVCTCICS